MRFKCNHCGRIFKEKCAHKCNTGFRKRHLDWIEVDDDVAMKSQQTEQKTTL